ncbi:MAG: J domain-containing protein [Ignavibacteriales bacterium]|nr:J domain-containing protein [Ignavibacteriales bacterium]
MTDIQILGINESFSREELKKAYREKSKELHPDKSKDTLKSHLAMIRLNQAYSNLQKQLKEKPQLKKEKQTKDLAYSIYKNGIQKFQNIHPSKWKSYSIDGLFDPSAINTHSETPSIIQSLITEMSEAYRSFSIIINEYVNSPWYADSMSKMKEIEKLTLRYIKIKESYEREMDDCKQTRKTVHGLSEK